MKLKEFLISFSGLKEGKHTFNLKAEDAFFDYFEYSEIKHGSVAVDVFLHKHSTFLELDLSIKGEIETMCDRCTGNFLQKIIEERRVVVKFGEEFLDDGDELIILPPSENDLDISGLVYESIVLSVPSKRIHPEGQCNEETLQVLKDIGVDEIIEESENDPRWDVLKKLK